MPGDIIPDSELDFVVYCGEKEVLRCRSRAEADEQGRVIFDRKVKELGDEVVRAEFNPIGQMLSGMIHSLIVRRSGCALRMTLAVVARGQKIRFWY